jgi:hypothetical protein
MVSLTVVWLGSLFDLGIAIVLSCGPLDREYASKDSRN